MAEPVVCPACQKTFVRPGEFLLTWLTCPHCRAMVANPAATSSPPVNLARPAAPAPRSSATSTDLCPGCGKRTLSQWLFCAYCEHPLRSPVDGSPDPALRQDSIAVANRKSFFAALGTIGLIIAILPATFALAAGNPQPLGVLIAVVVAFLGISTLVHLVRNHGEITAYNIRRIALGAMVTAGVLVAISVVLVFAGAIFGFVVCAVSGGRC